MEKNIMKASKGIRIIGIEELPPGAIAAAALIRPEDMSLLTRDAALNLAGPFTHEAIESWSLADLGIIEGAMGAASSHVGVNQGISAMSRGLTEDMTRRMRDLIVVPHVDLMTQGMKSALNLAATYSVAADWQRRSFHVERSLPWVNSENIAYLEKWGGRLIGNPHNSLGTSSSWTRYSEDWYAGDEYDVSNGGKICVEELRVTQGTIGQLGNLFEIFFSPDQLPAGCFIVKGKRNWEWEIWYSNQSRRVAHDRAVMRPRAIGVIHGIDLPTVQISVFAYEQSDQSRLTSFAKHLKKQMEDTGFRFKRPGSKNRGVSAGVTIKLEQLRKLRSEHKRNGMVSIGRTTACELVGIDTRTVRAHDPDLYEHWYFLEFL
jgi:hypothetical protein